MMTDPIADMLTRIRNAQAGGKPEVAVPYSNLKFALARILEANGYLAQVEKTAEGNMILVLKYKGKQPLIRGLDRISKPGQRVYRGADELPRVLNDLGLAIISTSQGLMTNKEARKRKLGGEVVCEIY